MSEHPKQIAATLAKKRKAVASQSNRLVNAAYTLTLTEKRLVLLAASKIDSVKPWTASNDAGAFKVSCSDYAGLFDVAPANAFRDVQEAANRLTERTITYKADNGDKVVMRWVWKVRYAKNQGYVVLSFTPDVLEYLSLLQTEFTQISLEEAGKLQSFYSIRFYELLKQYLKIGSRFLSIEQLRELLVLNEKYDSTANLKKWVVEPSVKEISAKTDLSVSYLPRKVGRKVVGWLFTIEKQKQRDLFL